MFRLAQKKLGFRTLFDLIPLNPELVKGSHGLPAADPLDRPLMIGNGMQLASREMPMTDVHDLILNYFQQTT
jgi:hypothetical protein